MDVVVQVGGEIRGQIIGHGVEVLERFKRVRGCSHTGSIRTTVSRGPEPPGQTAQGP